MGTNTLCITEIKTEDDLLPPGAPSGSIPTDLEQATGLERLEILGKMQGIDVFDMKPFDASRKGVLNVFTLYISSWLDAWNLQKPENNSRALY